MNTRFSPQVFPRAASGFGALTATLALALALAAAPAISRAETTDKLEKTFTVSPGGTIDIDVDVGGLEVRSAAGNQVVIEVTRKVRASSEDREKEILALHEVSFEQEGNTIRVHGRRRDGAENSWRDLFRGNRTSTDFRYRVTVPEAFDARLKTAGGGIVVAGLHGDVRARTSGGGLDFRDIVGPIDGHTSGGGIELHNCEGETKVRTSGGGISTRGGRGHFDVETSGGGIDIRSHTGDLRAHTSGGSITSEQVSGRLDAHTSGGSIRATLKAQPDGECRLNTSGGGVTVRLPANAAVEIDASTSAGRVHSDWPMPESTDRRDRARSQLRTSINGGGPLVHLRSSAGSIEIKKLDTGVE